MNPAPTSRTADFRVFLQTEYLRRCKANSSYSLRAFSRALEIEPSALSKILKAQRRISASTFEHLSKKLGLTPGEVALYAPREKLTRKKNRSSAETVLKVSDYYELSPELLETVLDWKNFSILELIQTRGFTSDPKWIAQQLKITISQVNFCVERMREAGLLKVQPDGTWQDCSGTFSAGRTGFTSSTLREYQNQILQKSVEALTEVSIQERDHGGMCMAIDSTRIPEAKERIKTFRRELCEFLKGNEPESRDRVYFLATSLFPVSFNFNSEISQKPANQTLKRKAP